MPPKRDGEPIARKCQQGSLDSPGVKPPYKCPGVVSDKTSSIDLFENVQTQISAFSGGQYH